MYVTLGGKIIVRTLSDMTAEGAVSEFHIEDLITIMPIKNKLLSFATGHGFDSDKITVLYESKPGGKSMIRANSKPLEVVLNYKCLEKLFDMVAKPFAGLLGKHKYI
jgi:hypothetical protein